MRGCPAFVGWPLHGAGLTLGRRPRYIGWGLRTGRGVERSKAVTREQYEDFVFIPADLAEEVDIDLERKKAILYAHAHLDAWDHWRTLGVKWNATVDQARAAYLDKVKVFHPDRYGGKNLGSYRGRLERIFRRMTEAKDLLTDEARRAEYAAKTAPPEEFAKMAARRIEDEARAQERRARLNRQNPLLARAGKISELVQRGKKLMEEGKFSQAANDFLTVASLDPRNAEAKALGQEARKRAGQENARAALERGLAAETVNNLQAAQAAFVEAASADPDNPRYCIHAARVSLALGDQEAARLHAEAAVRAGPKHAPAHEMLGEVLLAAGMQREARKALERAVELDPNLESARARLKKTRWSLFG